MFLSLMVTPSGLSVWTSANPAAAVTCISASVHVPVAPDAGKVKAVGPGLWVTKAPLAEGVWAKDPAKCRARGSGSTVLRLPAYAGRRRRTR